MIFFVTYIYLIAMDSHINFIYLLTFLLFYLLMYLFIYLCIHSIY